MPDESTPPAGGAQNDPIPGGAQPQLFIVDQAEIDTVLALPLPPHATTTFDEAEFKDLVARSFSITIDEKKEIVSSVSKFTQHQVDELFRILREERIKFADLNARHAARLQDLEAKHGAQWNEVETQGKRAEEEAAKRAEDERKAEEIRKQLGI